MKLIQLCCCAIKPHAYFLLLNYYTLIVCASVQREMTCIFGTSEDFMIFNMYLKWVIYDFHVIFCVLTIITTCFYAFQSIYSSQYHQFYINYQIVFSIVLLVHYAITTYRLFTFFANTRLMYFILYWKILNTVLIALLLGSSFKLKEIMYGTYVDEEDEIPNKEDEELKYDNEAGEGANKPLNEDNPDVTNE